MGTDEKQTSITTVQSLHLWISDMSKERGDEATVSHLPLPSIPPSWVARGLTDEDLAKFRKAVANASVIPSERNLRKPQRQGKPSKPMSGWLCADVLYTFWYIAIVPLHLRWQYFTSVCDLNSCCQVNQTK